MTKIQILTEQLIEMEKAYKKSGCSCYISKIADLKLKIEKLNV